MGAVLDQTRERPRVAAGRLLYFPRYFDAKTGDDSVGWSFCVPSGTSGNVLADGSAHGAAVDRLSLRPRNTCSTFLFFRTGRIAAHRGQTFATISPSMGHLSQGRSRIIERLRSSTWLGPRSESRCAVCEGSSVTERGESIITATTVWQGAAVSADSARGLAMHAFITALARVRPCSATRSCMIVDPPGEVTWIHEPTASRSARDAATR